MEMIRLLETAGANLAATYRGGNALHYAMTNESLEVIQHLASNGVDMNAEDCVGERPLHIAIHQGFVAGVDFILQSTLQIDSINRASDHCGTPLYCAAREGNITLVEKFLCAGAFVNVVVLPGNILGPALYVACAEGHVKLVKILLSHGADREVRTTRYKSAVQVAKAFEQIEVLEVLENYGQSDMIFRGPKISFETSRIAEEDDGTGEEIDDDESADRNSTDPDDRVKSKEESESESDSNGEADNGDS